MNYLYINPETKEKFVVNIHNFDRTGKKVRIIGNIQLNPSDKNYPDKKWIETDELLNEDGLLPQFSKEFIKQYSL